ncbi:MAG: DNA-processing protein DprA [Pseudomonadota bacterium]
MMMTHKHPSFRCAQHLIVHQLSGLTGRALRRLVCDIVHSAQAQDVINALIQHQAAAQCQSLMRHVMALADNPAVTQITESDSVVHGLRAMAIIARQTVWIAQHGASIVAWCEPNYPALLTEIPQPPAFLYLRGNASLVHCPQIAMVGARKATSIGLKTAYELASGLAQTGVIVSSGLALGVDGRCHLGALDQQRPTLAVLGTGIDMVYPKRHAALTQRIIDNGLLVSELPLGSAPLAHHFPMRNRLLSGLSLGVVVVEANEKSGSLITARCALEQGREVFAVPGSIHNPMTSGCHHLIKEGATLVQRADDVMLSLTDLGLFQWLSEHVQNECDDDGDAVDEHDVCERVWHAIQDHGSSFDAIVSQCADLSMEVIRATLIELECQTRVSCTLGQYMKH